MDWRDCNCMDWHEHSIGPFANFWLILSKAFAIYKYVAYAQAELEHVAYNPVHINAEEGTNILDLQKKFEDLFDVTLENEKMNLSTLS